MQHTTKNSFYTYRKSSINPPRGLTYFKPIRGGGLIETGGLVNLEKTIVSVLREELEYKVETFKNKKVECQNQIWTSS